MCGPPLYVHLGMMELTAPSLPMVFCDGFCLGSGPFFMVCSVAFCSCVVDTHI